MSPPQELPVVAPFAGTVIAIAHEPDESVVPGTALIVLEAMKMEHEVIAQDGGVVRRLDVRVGDTVAEGQVLAVLEPGEQTADGASAEEIPADLEEVREEERSETVTPSAWTRRGPTRSPSATSAGTGPLARTSTTSSTRARSSSTGR